MILNIQRSQQNPKVSRKIIRSCGTPFFVSQDDPCSDRRLTLTKGILEGI